MSKYRIMLEGKTYEMEIELLAGNDTPQRAIKDQSTVSDDTPKAANASAIEPSERKQAVDNPGVVVAPMPGTVIRIVKGEGQEVKAGDLVMILEAMKMENEILAPVSGSIAKMNCTTGGTVAGGEVLFEIK